MRKSDYSIISFSMVFLLFIQMSGTLVASIYTLDLLNTSLDEKVLGLLFFFFPVIFYFIKKSYSGWMLWFFAGILILARGFLPGLDTAGRMLISGIGTAACLGLFPYFLSSGRVMEETRYKGLDAAMGLALAVAVSVMLRTINAGIDYSLTSEGMWVGWVLGLILLGSLVSSRNPTNKSDQQQLGKIKGVTSSILGIMMVITLVYFIFSAPAVLARWTEGNYPAIVLAVSLVSIGWFILRRNAPNFIDKISWRLLVILNIFFTLALLATTLSHRVVFPENMGSKAVIVSTPSFWQHLPLAVLILLLPILFINFEYLWGNVQKANASPRQMAPGLMLGSLSLVVIVFMNIFTNVWGYVEPVSPFFRNKFYLPYVVISLLLCIVVFRNKYEAKEKERIDESNKKSFPWVWGVGLVIVLFLTGNGMMVKRVEVRDQSSVDSLTVMTYNIQQGNDNVGEQSYIEQLALIQKADPDILVLQECDSTRISLNNIDLVRFFADNLGYYSYYGPKTISGSYGTAILAKFPLINSQSIFTFSDQDENGTSYAQIEIGSRLFNIYNVHPDGSDDAKMAFAKMLLDKASGQTNVIIMGDFNLRDYEQAYQMINDVFTNAWMDSYPTGISSDGLDMSGKNRIDHIFISRDLSSRNPVYILPPDSKTDHPVHWTEIYWEN